MTTTTTTTTTTPVNRVLDTVRGAAFLPAIGEVIDTRSAEWSAVGTAVGLAPGLYAIESHTVQSEKNRGKQTVRILSADLDTLTAQRQDAAGKLAQWQDPAWVQGQRDAAAQRVADLDARIARLAPVAPVAPVAPAADLSALAGLPADKLAAILAILQAG